MRKRRHGENRGRTDEARSLDGGDRWRTQRAYCKLGNTTTVTGSSGQVAAVGEHEAAKGMLGIVYVPRAVRADNRVLDAGAYRVRLAGEALKPVAGETPNLERWVEFLQGDSVGARPWPQSFHPTVSIRSRKDPRPEPGRVRIDILRRNDYLRLWINESGDHYLIHLPLVAS